MRTERSSRGAAPFDARRFPRKLNLGCGWDKKPGYLNVDLQAFHEPDLVADVTDLQELPAGHYEEVVAHDILEHLGRLETPRVLAEWNRVLAPGGRLDLRVPDVLGVAELLRRPENQAPEAQARLVRCLFGTQGYPGDFHLTTFTERLIAHYLEQSGFRVVSLAARDGWLLDVVAEKIAEAPHDELFDAPDDAEFVARAYRRVLRREPDEAGLRFYVSKLRARELTRAALLALLAESDEARALGPGGAGGGAGQG